MRRLGRRIAAARRQLSRRAGRRGCRLRAQISGRRRLLARAGICVGLLLAAVPAAAFFDWHRVGTRALALGDNFVSVADDASALYWNPAGLVRVPQHQALFTVERAPDLEGLQHLFAGTVLHTRFLSAGAGWSATRLEGTLREDLFAVSISRHLVRRTLGAFIAAGATLKVARVGVDGAEAAAFGGSAPSETHLTGDLGLLLAPIPNVTLGASVRNLGRPRFDLVPGGSVTALESEYEWGVTLRIRPEAQLHFTRSEWAGQPTESRFGAELHVGSSLDLRFGVSRQAVSTGLGVRWRQFRLEPSFRMQRELGLVTRVGLLVGFGALRGEAGDGFDAY